ncbi:MAG: TrkA family potassium uptake protein [Halobacteriales archaeon]
MARRRTVYYFALVVTTTLAFTVVYNTGMDVWESDPQPLYRSLEVVIQSFTTTGYGEDAGWQTPQMNGLVILMQFTGIGLILTAVDVFAVPWLRDALSPAAPESLPELEDHVIICGHTPRTDVLIGALETRDRSYVLLDPDAGVASDLHGEGYRVMQGDPESAAVLEKANIGSAIAVVADAADDTNASIALSATEANPDVRVVSLVEDATLVRYHRLAGTDAALSPRQLLGESLAEEVPTVVTTTAAEGVEIGDDFGLAEISIEPGSELADRPIMEARLRERFGVNVIGVWSDGEFRARIDPTESLDPGTRLLVAGSTDRVAEVREATAATVSDVSDQTVLIAGYGETGGAAYDALADTRADLTVLDIEASDQVDVVADARDPDGLRAAGIEDTSVLVLTVAEDTTAVFATLIARDLNPDLRIVVRANEEADVRKLYRAGADYVQSLATVSGRMLASRVLEGEDLIPYDTQVSVVRTSAPGLAGRTIADADVRSETGASVIAIIRDGETIPDFDPTTITIDPDDDVVIAGTDEDVTRFERRFGD